MRYLYIFVLALTFPVTLSCKESEVEAIKPSSYQWLKVVNVTDNDTLNLRAYTQSQSEIIYKIPHDAANLLKIGEEDNWIKVSYRGFKGWVYSKYVTDAKHLSIAAAFGGELFCIGTEPHWNIETKGYSATFSKYSDKKNLVINDIVRKSANEDNTWMSALANADNSPGNYTAVLEKTNSCSDGMSDETYPLSIKMIDDKTQLISGCCKILKQQGR